jgi:hypothetical protein
MAIGAGTVTLADYAQMSNAPLVQAVSMSLINYGNVAQDVPLLTKKSLIANGVRFEGNLPTVNWAQLNAEGITTKGTPTPYQEQVYLIRNYIDVDKMLVDEENAIVDPRATQVAAYLQSLTYDFNTKFFNNDHITGDPNSFVGLKYRIANGGTFGVRPENLINGGSVDLTVSTTMTQATANQFLVLLDQLLWSVDSPEGNGVVLYVNEVLKRQFAAAVRLMGTSGGFTTMQDQFNRTIQMYKGAIIRDPGYQQDQATRIIPGGPVAGGTLFGENAAGTGTSTSAGSIFTSVYAVNYGTDHFHGWQFSEPNVQDLGLIYNGVIYRTMIDWALGLMNSSTRSIGRLYGVKVA